MVINNRMSGWSADAIPRLNARRAKLPLQRHSLYQKAVFMQTLNIHMPSVDLQVAHTPSQDKTQLLICRIFYANIDR